VHHVNAAGFVTDDARDYQDEYAGNYACLLEEDREGEHRAADHRV